MNQILKDCVYGRGTRKQMDFIAELGGMNEEERSVFQMIHEKRTDNYIMDTLGLSKNSYSRVEESVRTKLLLAIFECINCHMYELEK